MIATVPFQPLMAQPEGVSIRCWNGYASLRLSTFRSSEIEPPAPLTQWSLHVVQPHVDIVLGQGPVVGDYVRPRTGQVRHCHLADSNVEVLNACTITAHVQRIEVVDLDGLAAVVAFPGPAPCVRLALPQVSGLE